MQYNIAAIIFGALICLVLVANAQETTTTPETGNEQVLDQVSTIRPSSTSKFLRLLHDPMRRSFSSARRFIRNRLDNVYHAMNMTRLQTYKIFMSIYNKTYSPQELPRRMALFFKRREVIQQSVKAYVEGKSTYYMKENAFTDMEDDELKQLMGVSIPSAELAAHGHHRVGSNVSNRSINYDLSNHESPSITVKAFPIPVSKDWRTSGCIGTPMNQRSCGSCYAIATVGVVESMRCLRNPQQQQPVHILSPQQIVDCANEQGYSVWGCNGGYPDAVLEYLQNVGMIARDRCYPYVHRKEACKLQQVQAIPGCVVSASVTPGQRLQFQFVSNERDLVNYVANVGPAVTIMEVMNSFFYLGGGIYDDPLCPNEFSPTRAHAVAIVGYGTENGLDYWLIKNTWGPDWALGGFAKIRRNKSLCLIGIYNWVVTTL